MSLDNMTIMDHIDGMETQIMKVRVTSGAYAGRVFRLSAILPHWRGGRDAIMVTYPVDAFFALFFDVIQVEIEPPTR